MNRVMSLLGIAGAVTAFIISLKIIDSFQIAQQEVSVGNTDVIGQFIIVSLVGVIAVLLLSIINPSR